MAPGRVAGDSDPASLSAQFVGILIQPDEG